MLEKHDTYVVRQWLARALQGKDEKGRRTLLATHCGVKPQAVSGWLKTGRITKRNLELATQFFGHGPSFTQLGAPAKEPAPKTAAPPPLPPFDFHDTRAPSNSEWQVLRDLEVYPEEERKKLMAELHAQAERWRAIERELTSRAKARSKGIS